MVLSPLLPPLLPAQKSKHLRLQRHCLAAKPKAKQKATAHMKAKAKTKTTRTVRVTVAVVIDHHQMITTDDDGGDHFSEHIGGQRDVNFSQSLHRFTLVYS